MSILNDEFMEIYKRIDAFCREIYKTDKGITSYIDEMSHISGANWGIWEWNETLTKLKNYRHIRNAYTHDVGTSYTDICTQEDIEWLQEFHDKLMHAQDPLSVYENKKRASSRPVTREYIRPNQTESTNEQINSYQKATSASYQQEEYRKSNKGCLIFILVFIVVIVLAVLLVLSLFGVSLAYALKLL